MEDFYRYLDSSSAEARLGIRFRPIDGLEWDELIQTLSVIANRLMLRDLPPLPRPPKGVLKTGLETNTRALLNDLLADQYAGENISQQQRLQKEVPIEESGEEMRFLFDEIAGDAVVSYSQTTFHEACGEKWAGAPRIFALRRTVAQDIRKVCRALNEAELMMHVDDCWRPPEVQLGLLIRRAVQLARDEPDWSWQKVKNIACSFTASSPGVASHQAGCAVDWRLRRLKGKDGHDFLDLGNEYAEGYPSSSLRFPYITFEQLRTRLLFSATMRMAGFNLLLTEDWHGDKGSRGMSFDPPVSQAIRIKEKAIYGPLLDFGGNGSEDLVVYDRDDIDLPHLSDAQFEMIVDAAHQGTQYWKKDKDLYRHIHRQLGKNASNASKP